MAAIRRTTITVEMSDGTVHGPERVIFADKMRFEKAARHNGWEMGRDEFRVQSFLSWAALHRTEQISIGYEDFLEQLTDVAFDVDSQDEDDPTTADTSA